MSGVKEQVVKEYLKNLMVKHSEDYAKSVYQDFKTREISAEGKNYKLADMVVSSVLNGATGKTNNEGVFVLSVTSNASENYPSTNLKLPKQYEDFAKFVKYYKDEDKFRLEQEKSKSESLEGKESGSRMKQEQVNGVRVITGENSYKIVTFNLYDELVSDRGFGSEEELKSYIRFALYQQNLTSQKPNYVYDDMVLSTNLRTGAVEVFDFGEQPVNSEVFNTGLENLLANTIKEGEGATLKYIIDTKFARLMESVYKHKVN